MNLAGFAYAAVAVVSVFLMTMCMILFWIRRKMPMIRARAPMLMLVSAVGGMLIILSVCLGEILPPAHDIGCELYKWMHNIGYTTFVMPYLFRCALLYFVFNINAQRLGAIGALVPAYVAEESPKNSFEDSASVLPLLHQGPGSSSLVNYTESNPCQSKKVVGRDGKFLRKQQHQAVESYWLRVFLICLIVVIGVSIVESVMDPHWTWVNPGCVGQTISHTGQIIRLFLNLLNVGVFLCALFLLRNVRDAWSVKWELVVFVVINVVFGIVLSVVIALHLKNESAGSFYNRAFSAIDIGRVLLMFGLGVVQPLLQSYRADDGGIVLWSSLESITSLDKCLKDAFCLRYFQQYLSEEFALADLIFYMDIELFRDIYDKEVLEDAAAETHANFLSEDAPFRIELSPDTRTRIQHQLWSPNRNMYNTAQREVHARLEDSFTRFLKSKHVHLLVDALNEEENLRSRLKHSQLL